MSYYDLYCRYYENRKKFHFCDSEIFEILGIEPSDVSVEDDLKIISHLDDFLEVGFNEGFIFAMKIFFNNLNWFFF